MDREHNLPTLWDSYVRYLNGKVRLGFLRSTNVPSKREQMRTLRLFIAFRNDETAPELASNRHRFAVRQQKCMSRAKKSQETAPILIYRMISWLSQFEAKPE